MDSARYQRQMLLPGIGEAGQRRLRAARVLIVGCGALGAGVADQLTRGGIGYLRIVDRDLVERSNLQRQILYDESDVDRPKAVAASQRLHAINSEIEIDAVVGELNQATVDQLASTVDLIIDGTDNVATRYLLNDFAVQEKLPWIYGGCVATEGRCMLVRPGITPCLRCLYPEPIDEADLPTCDTMGILGAAAAIVASMQATSAIQLLSGHADDVPRGLTTFDVWNGQWRRIATQTERNPACAACGNVRSARVGGDSKARVLCGRNAVQFYSKLMSSDFSSVAAQWQSVGDVRRGEQIVRFKPTADAPVELTLFQDGRVIVHGISDLDRARQVYERYIA